MRNVFVAAVLMLAFLLFGLQLLLPPETAVFAQAGSGLPVVEYLGSGEADFNEPDWNFAATPASWQPLVTPSGTPQPTATPTSGQPLVTPSSTLPAVPPVGVPPAATPTVPPSHLTCTRFNFDLGQNHDTGSLVPGLYTMREVGTGSTLATWWAASAWEDSGWITDIYIAFPSVWVEVFFYPYGGEPAVNMNIINPAYGTAYGWLTGGMCHAIEIEFPSEWAP